MARNRTTSANLALLVGPTPATGSHAAGLDQILRIQSLSYSFDNPKENIQQYGSAASIARETTNPPNVSLNFSYYVTSIDNEVNIGFYPGGDQSCLKYILDKTQDEKNYFVFVAPDGADATGLTGADGRVKGFGNGFVNSYSIEGAVGGFPTASVAVQCSNMTAHADGVSEQIPAVDTTTGLRITGQTFTIGTLSGNFSGSQPKVIRPGDITLDLSNAGGLFHSVPSGCVQSFSINFDLNREPINCLGSRFPRAREVQFPVDVNFQVEMLANDIVTGDLSQFICQTGLYNASIAFKAPSCSGDGARQVGITLKNLSLESQNWTTQVGGVGETLSISWLGQIGGTGDLSNGMFMSGAYTP